MMKLNSIFRRNWSHAIRVNNGLCVKNKFRCKHLAVLILLGFAPINAVNAQVASLRVQISDATDNTLIQPYIEGGEITISGGEFNIQVQSTVPVVRMRMTPGNSGCSIENQPDFIRIANSRFYQSQFSVSANNTVCDLFFEAWQENYRWVAHMNVRVNFTDSGDDGGPPNPPVSDRRYNITQGTMRSAEMDTSSPVVAESSHGVRVYCGVSHFSYDDPVVHPNNPDAAHLHMFWGNTGSDAFSTADTLFSNGASSCEGGINNKSSYWMPALFDENNQVVLPERLISYYKSFASTGGFDRNAIRSIPNGLQMLANSSVRNGGPWNLSINSAGAAGLTVRILFPNCLQVNANYQPVLQSADNISHLSYAVGAGETPGDCPASHPYRIPQLSYNIDFPIPYNSAWSLASDHHGMQQGASLHADYFAAWDETTMNRIVQCNRESRRECQFVSFENGQALYRNQLPERFLSEDGETVYLDSTTLAPSVDRTPFGSSLTKMR